MITPSAYPHEVPPTGTSAAFAANLRAQLPQLETERLILRAPQLEDFATYRDILMSERAQYLSDEPMSRRDAWLDFTQCISQWHLRGHGLFTITACDNGAIHGFILICIEYGDREPELGWFLTENAEGQGIASEAAQSLRDWGIKTAGLPSLVSYIDPPNTRSVALAERLGAWRDEKAEAAFDEPILVYRHHPREART